MRGGTAAARWRSLLGNGGALDVGVDGDTGISEEELVPPRHHRRVEALLRGREEGAEGSQPPLLDEIVQRRKAY